MISRAMICFCYFALHMGVSPSLIWNKGISDSVRVDIVNDRLMCVNLNFNNQSVLLLNVYMPYDDRSRASYNVYFYWVISTQ